MTSGSAGSGTSSRPPSNFLRELNVGLASAMALEIQVTAKIAVMKAAGLTRQEIQRRLMNDGTPTTDTEIKMAFIRLERLVAMWKNADD